MPVPLLGADELVEIFRVEIVDWHSTVLSDSWQETLKRTRVGMCGPSRRALRRTSLFPLGQLLGKWPKGGPARVQPSTWALRASPDHACLRVSISVERLSGFVPPARRMLGFPNSFITPDSKIFMPMSNLEMECGWSDEMP